MLKSLTPKETNVKLKIVDIRLKSNLTTNKTMTFTEKTSFYTNFGFIQSHSGPIGDIEGFVQLIPGSYKSK